MLDGVAAGCPKKLKVLVGAGAAVAAACVAEELAGTEADAAGVPVKSALTGVPPNCGTALLLPNGIAALDALPERPAVPAAPLAGAVVDALPKANDGAGAVLVGAALKLKSAGCAVGTGPEGSAVVAGAESCSLAPSGVGAAPVGVEPSPPEVAAAVVTPEGAAAVEAAAVGKVKAGVPVGFGGGCVVATAVGKPARLATLGGPE